MAGVDIGKMKQRQEVEDAKEAARAAGGFKFWSPQLGENRLRFMPPWTEEGPNANDFARESYVHWNIGPEEKGVTFTCPVRSPNGPGGDCPACVHVKALRATEDAADQEMAADDAAKQRFFSNIVDLDDEFFTAEDVTAYKTKNQGGDCPFEIGDTKVQVFSYGPMIYKDLLDIFADNIDITDLDTGWDIQIKKTGKGKTGTSYRVKLDNNKGECAFAFKSEKKTLADRLVNLDNLMPYKSLEDMNAALSGVVVGSQMPAGAPPPQLPAASAPPANTQPAPAPAPSNGAAPTSAVQVAEAPEEEPPICFKITEGENAFFNETDAECIGGEKDLGGDDGIQVFEACPWFAECKSHCNPEPVKKKRRGRRKAAAAPAPGTGDPVDSLEAEMKANLNK